MIFRFHNMDTKEFREYTPANIDGGAEAAWDLIMNLYELKKRNDRNEYAVLLKVVGMDFDVDFFEVNKYVVEVIGE